MYMYAVDLCWRQKSCILLGSEVDCTRGLSALLAIRRAGHATDNCYGAAGVACEMSRLFLCGCFL